METVDALILALTASLASAITWMTCHWWYGRRVDAIDGRLQKAEKARQFSTQQTLVARKQIEALQKDLASQQRALSDAHVARQRLRHMEDVLREAAAAEAQSDRSVPANGFADTQPMM